MTAAPAIRIENLVKRYAPAKGANGTMIEGKLALGGVSFDVPEGSIFGLLGPNGAGKSTLINILAGLVNKTSGACEIWGFDIDYGVPGALRRSEELLAAVRLADKRNAYARTLSGGMKRRLLVAKAMVHSPPILVLDEPTAGVDVELRRQLWELVSELNREGVTVVLTTHYLEEAEELCDRIAIINHGQLIANKPTQELIGMAREKIVAVTVADDLAAAPAHEAFVKATWDGARAVEVTYDKDRLSAGQVLAILQEQGLTIEDVTTREADLEDVFVQLTGTAG
ncbi:MAG: multidrug ABC transporter ATP-binding protein [Alphaproteobacteria bacterium HGW-Alphaproteobacteria-14]|nr:MAG: multidrug ABC transporter ATP-binding protein [Alphaproteobacteria bacterium HGW-Alphaproteobacteria-14]